jgi:hypothetical protein
VPTHSGFARSRVYRWLTLTLTLSLAASACTTGPPPPVSAQELAHGETFPYYKLYWVGRYFLGHPLTAVDGRGSYDPAIGQSVYYGNCSSRGGLLGEGSCKLPLQITTVIYAPHSNRDLGEQENALIRGVPASIYDMGHSIELYTGHVAIEISSDTAADALRAARRLRPLNAPGAAGEALPVPTYCPGLYGPVSPAEASLIARVRARLPQRACAPLSVAAGQQGAPRRPYRSAARGSG